MHRTLLRAAAASAVVTAFLSSIASAGSSPVLREATRVTNGVLTQERPTTGGLLYGGGGGWQVICTGTLIGCETFLTAAHCVCEGSTFGFCGTPSPGQHAVYLQNVGIVPVASIDVDPTYDFGTRGDVAVLTLSTPVTGVPPTPINTSQRPPFGTSAEIVGFGLSRGGANDTGMLRRGITETGDCNGAADGGFHVCWSFENPLGAPGTESNTCNGDSGGPLFADLGFGETVVGITSGGTSEDCLPTDLSYDADVYVHRAFIEGIGGADLLNSSCGSIAQVGEPGAEVTTFDFDTRSKQARACRKAFAKMSTSYAVAARKATQACLDGVNDGSRTGPCPDAEATDALASAASRVSELKLAAKCPADVVPVIDTAGACTGATDAGDLVDCILAGGDDAVADAIDLEYIDPATATPIGDADALACQAAVGSAGAGLFKALLKARAKCQSALDAGKATGCPDAKASAAMDKAEAKAASVLAAACDDASVLALHVMNSFGGACAAASDLAALTTCQAAGHDAVSGDVIALLEDDAMQADFTVEVGAGVDKLRFTLNGKDDGANDLDLFVRFGSAATTSVYDARSVLGGMFEEIEVDAPTAGTWHVHVARYAGPALIPHQLTVTALEP